MAEKYVKLNDVIETLENEWGYEGMREDLEKLPTADVVEVKHGYWIEDRKKISTAAGVDMTALVGYRCSLCGRRELHKEPYCNCGAKME